MSANIFFRGVYTTSAQETVNKLTSDASTFLCIKNTIQLLFFLETDDVKN